MNHARLLPNTASLLYSNEESHRGLRIYYLNFRIKLVLPTYSSSILLPGQHGCQVARKTAIANGYR